MYTFNCTLCMDPEMLQREEVCKLLPVYVSVVCKFNSEQCTDPAMLGREKDAGKCT